MRIPSFSQRAAALLGACLVLCTGAARAFAADFSSADFIARDSIVDTSGGSASSSNYSAILGGGQVAPGDSTSTDFEVRSGTLMYDSFSPEGEDWRWYDDETDETPTSPLDGAGENVAPSGVADGNIVKLRWTLAESAGIGDTGVKFALQFATSSDFEDPIYVVEQGACTGSSQWCYALGAGSDNATITTAVLSDSGPCSGGAGNGCGTHNESGVSTSTFTQEKNAATEYEFTIVPSGATPDTVYFFRAVLTGASTTVPLSAGASYPSLSTSGGTLTFSIDGLPAATTTSGVTTTIDTTSTDVPFGDVPLSGSSIGANRLTISTNASAGYEIYAYERQQLLNEYGASIPPVGSTNASPASWSSACTSTSTGCWGYHTSAPVLSGGSTRFAPDDTYAQFTSSPDEVGYSSGPVTDETTDVVYRLAVDDGQDAGDYSTQLVYIITPVF